MKRCFIALALPDATATELLRAQADLAQSLAPGTPVRWVPRANLHLTLKFLGHVPDAQLVPLTAALQRLAATCAPLHAQAAGLGVFGGPRPRAIYAGIAAGRAEVIALMTRIEVAMSELGLAAHQHKARVPHVTLARLPPAASAPELSRCITQQPTTLYGPLDGHAMVLYESVLGPDGSHYTPMARMPLG